MTIEGFWEEGDHALELHILKGNGLPPMHLNGFADSYVIVRLVKHNKDMKGRASEFQTQVVPETLE